MFHPSCYYYRVGRGRCYLSVQKNQAGSLVSGGWIRTNDLQVVGLKPLVCYYSRAWLP
jgi:hypothetical protein